MAAIEIANYTFPILLADSTPNAGIVRIASRDGKFDHALPIVKEGAESRALVTERGRDSNTPSRLTSLRKSRPVVSASLSGHSPDHYTNPEANAA